MLEDYQKIMEEIIIFASIAIILAWSHLKDKWVIG